MRFLWLVFALAAAVASGCTHCCHKAYDQALSAEDCGVHSACQRSRVYAILVNGFDPLHTGQIEKLGTELNRQGFAKVYTVEFHHMTFIESEVRKIRCNDPEARFVIVGYRHGVSFASNLAAKLTRDCVPVDALVELVPAYLPLANISPDISRVGQHVVIGQAWHTTKYHHANSQLLVVPGAGTYTVATHAITAQTIRDILLASTAAVPEAEGPGYPILPLVDDPAPLPGEALLIAK